MAFEIADEAEVRCEAGLLQHPERVAAHRKHLAGFDRVVAVEIEAVGVLGNRASVDHGLAVVFAGVFQFGDGEQAVGGGVEARFPKE